MAVQSVCFIGVYYITLPLTRRSAPASTIVAWRFVQAHISGYGFEGGNRLFPHSRWPVFNPLHQFLESIFHTGIIANYASHTPLSTAGAMYAAHAISGRCLGGRDRRSRMET